MSPTHAEPSDEELKTLIQQLTLEEKISLLAGKSTWETASISRLDIPSLKVSYWAGASYPLQSKPPKHQC